MGYSHTRHLTVVSFPFRNRLSDIEYFFNFNNLPRLTFLLIYGQEKNLKRESVTETKNRPYGAEV